MFSGGGLAFADAAVKRGEFAIAPAEGARPDLSGLSCRFDEIPAVRGLILSVLVMPAEARTAPRVRRVIEDVIRLTERDPGRVGTDAAGAAAARLAAAGARISRRARSAAPGAAVAAQSQAPGVDADRLSDLPLQHPRSAVSRPEKYMRELVQNSDFRKFDDTLRMVIDCTPALADEVERRWRLQPPPARCASACTARTRP